MEQWRITMLGDGGVGKTALAVQYTTHSFVETYDPTIEDAFRHSIVVDDVKSYLEIVDTGGQEEYATLRDQWIHGSGAFILVYSIASRPTFDRIKMFQNSIVRVGGRTRPTIMLVGNKLDKASEREVSQVEAQAFGRQCGCAYMEISAKTASGVERMFNDTIRALRADREASYLRALQGYLAETEEARANGPNVKATSWAGALPTNLPQGGPSVDPLPPPSGRLRQEVLVMFSNLFGSSREKGKAKGQERELDQERSRSAGDGDRALWDMSRLIDYSTSTKHEDWAVVLEVCDRANQSEANARDACKVLRKDIQFGHPAAQLAAVKLWAIMMRKCSADFIAQTATRKFLGKIEEVVFSLTTSPVVRDRLVEVIGESVFQLKDTKHLKSYAATWKKLRSQLNLSAPIEGIKTSLDDPTLNPTSYRLPSSMREHPTCEQPNTKEEIVVPSNLSAPEMFQCLLEHGCTDVSSRINPNRQSATAVAGGSFGDIWMSELDDGTKVAIKCFRFHAIAEDQPKGLKRATREIYMWSKAKHPNVHELMGVIMFQGRLGMVSMWMENGSLHEYIRKNTSVDRYQLCVQVAAGVSYLHGICMVHGDIKALNILVSQDGVAKLSDFDHSILSNATLAFSATTNSGGGTLRWMAPELLASTEDENMLPAIRTTQTDVYALGMTMLEVITSKVPYSEYLQDQGIIRALDKNKPPARPKELVGTNEQANVVWALLLQCWDHDAAMRPGASSVLALLQDAVGKSMLST